MADRYPLIFDTTDEKFKELPSGDNLNLNNIENFAPDFINLNIPKPLFPRIDL